MRLGNFEMVGKKPLGSGAERDVFVNPENEEKVLSIFKSLPGERIASPNKIKGSYYLTKIAHILLPKNIPDISQAEISKDGKEVFNRQRISHTKGHEMLQKARQKGEDESAGLELMQEEMEDEINDVTDKLAEIGFAFNLDENIGNYTKDEKGNIYYLETFIPWGSNPENPTELELFFEKEDLIEAIEKLPERDKKICKSYLSRLMELFEEDKEKSLERSDTREMYIKAPAMETLSELENVLYYFENKHDINLLMNIKTFEEAVNSFQRQAAKKDFSAIFKLIHDKKLTETIPEEKFNKLRERYLIIERAIGTVNGDYLDHSVR
ncbi:MAG: hypothetical protein R3B39_02545 [Candidatus Paceibacterota bacterium]